MRKTASTLTRSLFAFGATVGLVLSGTLPSSAAGPDSESDQGTFEPGSGTGRWATPHKACVSTAVVGWRGRVDVDLSWQVDPFGYDYSQARDLSCSPA